MSDTVLIIGAGGQIGTELSESLREIYGESGVIVSDLKESYPDPNYVQLDVTNKDRLEQIVKSRNVTQIYHLAAILSATGEKDPVWAWSINMNGLINVLEVSRQYQIKKIFYPSSIAVFGIEYDQILTPQYAVLIPETVYGISKAAGENWSNYYCKKYGMDIRSVRYPGIIGHKSMPGGGTTDYAVDIFHHAVQGKNYTCFLSPETTLPMMYMEDALRATIELMEAPAEKVKLHTGYNLAGCSFSPKEITASIQRHYPDFKVHYEPDFRQGIADLWPQRIDDHRAREDWGWQPKYDLNKMVDDMIENLKLKYR